MAYELKVMTIVALTVGAGFAQAPQAAEDNSGGGQPGAVARQTAAARKQAASFAKSLRGGASGLESTFLSAAGGSFFTIPFQDRPQVQPAAAAPANASAPEGASPDAAPEEKTPAQPAADAAQPQCVPLGDEELSRYVQEAAEEEGVTPDLLRAMIRKESSARPCAVSSKGAQGLMQLMPSAQLDMGVKDPFDPKQNIRGGARLMKRLLTRYGGDLALALGAYNAGPGNVDRAGGVPPFPETTSYVSGLLEELAPR